MSAVKILIVEDDHLIAEDISSVLEDFGYEIVGLTDNGPDALDIIVKKSPDIALLDINIKGNWDGIETAAKIRESYDLPLIFLTALSNKTTFDRAKLIEPDAYIIKPFDERDLQAAIELAVYKFWGSQSKSTSNQPFSEQIFLDDRMFVKVKGRLEKVSFEDIFWIEADRNYSNIYLSDRKYTVATALRQLEIQLPNNIFFRIHRSYLLNLRKIEAIEENMVVLKEKSLPIGRNYREALMKQMYRF